MLEICIQTSYDQNVQLILKSYGTTLKVFGSKKIKVYKQDILREEYLTLQHFLGTVNFNNKYIQENNVSAEIPTTERMTPLGINSPPAEVSTQ